MAACTGHTSRTEDLRRSTNNAARKADMTNTNLTGCRCHTGSTGQSGRRARMECSFRKEKAVNRTVVDKVGSKVDMAYCI